MSKSRLLIFSLFILFINRNHVFAQTLSLDEIRNYPFPTNLNTSIKSNRITWAFDEQGKRNVYVAEGPTFKARKLTNYNIDDGQEISSLSISADGNWIVYVRGGDHGSLWNDEDPVNVNSDLEAPVVQMHSVSFDGKKQINLGEGESPIISPNGDEIVFIKKGQVWISKIDKINDAKPLFKAKGTIKELQWSPDGLSVAFVASRDDHAFIGIYSKQSSNIRWINPSFSRDRSPRWSPDGLSLAFVRTPCGGGAPDSVLTRKHVAWSIWKADVASGDAKELWKAPNTLAGSIPSTNGGTNLIYGINNKIAFVSSQDGWSHLYSISANGGAAIQLTKGKYIVEQVVLSTDKKWLYYSANTGNDIKDIDRRHIARVPIDKPAPEVLSPGKNLQWAPMQTGNGKYLVFITSNDQKPALPAVIEMNKLAQFDKEINVLAQEHLAVNFPNKLISAPEQIVFNSIDGLPIHAQLFKGKGNNAKKPAIIYIHGGPSRQMLLGWNYSEYYSNAYAVNQYLASLGFNVLSVNYRMGIGYGYEFQNAPNCGSNGAAEYQDIKAAALWLSTQSDIDASRIGVYGGSYGGYLTNMALAKDSKIFAAGVSVHGMGDLTVDNEFKTVEKFGKAPDAALAEKIMWESSPVAHINSWKSPILLIHADDDRNVHFSQSSDVYKRLTQKNVSVESLVIVNDTHHLMKYENQQKVNKAIVDFFVRKLRP
jgi:dipeptidyl aminopeptidase/acylaminoacyl peptidase